ncbi:MAG: ferritin family protein [Pseudomonadota bacterium]
MSIASRIPDLESFFAYSIALEEEAAERHEELANMLEVHNNDEVADIFRKLAHYSRLHAAEVKELAGDRVLPTIAPWDFGWDDLEGPETASIDDMDYLISPRRALEVALANERSARSFYAGLGQWGLTEAIRRTAAEFAEEEAEHVELLEDWLQRTPADDALARFDPDPPHMPE